MDSFNELWGDSHNFHVRFLPNKKVALVIVGKNASTEGDTLFLDFCVHNSFEEANQTLYFLSYGTKNSKEKIIFNHLLKTSGGGGSFSTCFFFEIIDCYRLFVINQNLPKSSVNLFICNSAGMKKIYNYCLLKGFVSFSSSIFFRPPNYIDIKTRFLAKNKTGA